MMDELKQHLEAIALLNGPYGEVSPIIVSIAVSLKRIADQLVAMEIQRAQEANKI